MLVGPCFKFIGEPSHLVLVTATFPVYQIIKKVVYALLSTFDAPSLFLKLMFYTLVSLTTNEMFLSSF
jgi:hypothetical protein